MTWQLLTGLWIGKGRTKKGSVHEDFQIPVGAHKFCTTICQISAKGGWWWRKPALLLFQKTGHIFGMHWEIKKLLLQGLKKGNCASGRWKNSKLGDNYFIIFHGNIYRFHFQWQLCHQAPWKHSLHETSTDRNGLILMLGQVSQTPVNAGFSTGFLSIPTFFKDTVSGMRMDLFEATMQFMNTRMFLSSFQNGNISHL